MKKITKLFVALVAVAAMFMTSSVAFAASTNDGGWNTLFVTDKDLSSSDWGSSATISPGEKLNVELHYYLNEGVSATDMRFKVEDLDGRVFEAGSSETVTGSISADNLITSSGSATANFTDKVRLEIYNVTHQIHPCQSVGCEESLIDDPLDVLTSGGMTIGDVSGDNSHYTGNVIVQFRAIAVNDPPVVVYNDCTLNGVTVAHNETYRFYSRTSVADGQTCSAYDLVRKCTNGNFSGDPSFEYSSCTVNNPSANDPTVDTRTESNVEDDRATLNGYVDLTSDVDSGDVYFIWGTDKDNLNNDTSRVSRSSDGSFNRTITGLDDDTTYYYRAVLRGDDGVTYTGDRESFRTTGGSTSNGVDPDVVTRDADNIDEDAATINGFLDINESDEVDFWFQYGTDKDLDTYSRTSKEDYSTNKSVDERLTGLEDDTKYYFRAVIEDTDTGELYFGDIENFRTEESDEDNEVSAETKSPEDLKDDGADMRGYADINDADEAKVYFEYGTSASSLPNSTSPTYIGNSGNVTTEIEGLNACTTYYYRFVVEDEDSNDVDRGVVKSFTTKGDNCGTTTESTGPSTITRTATGVTTTSAGLGSYVFGEGTGSCYFEYGTTLGLGLTSPAQTTNLDNGSGVCSSTRFGLRPNTTYYYRSVLVNQGETTRGLTKSFRTNPTVSTPLPPVTPRPPVVSQPPVIIDDTVRVTVVEEVVGSELEVTKWVSAETDPEFGTRTDADRNEPVFYRVSVTNNTDETLTDVTVIDRIPFFLELDGERSLDDSTEKQVQWFLESLRAGETKTFITEMRVRDDAIYGDEISSFATATNDDYSTNSNDVRIDVDRDAPEVVATTTGGQAASIFGAGFFPTTLFGWLILLAIVLAIAYLISRILFSRNENERVLAELRAMQQTVDR